MTMRILFFEEDDAETAAARLRREGWATEVRAERLAGEDDDEDAQWALTSDAPPIMLELLAEELDAWVEYDEPETTRVEGLTLPPLPIAPKRIKRPPTTS